VITRNHIYLKMKKSLDWFWRDRPVTVPMPSATRIWPINTSYVYSDNLITPITDGGEAFKIKELNDTSSNNNLTFIGTDPPSGKSERISDVAYGSGLPKFFNKHGGMIFIANTFDRHFETSAITPAIAGACTFIKFRISLGGTLNEYDDNSSNSLGMMRDRSNSNLSWGKTNTEVNPGVGGLPAMYKVHMYVGYRNASGQLYAEVDGVPYNSGTLMSIGTNNITEHALGATGHPMDSLKLGADVLISGTQTTGDAAWLSLVSSWRSWFESNCGITLGSYPTQFPMVTFDSGGYDDDPIWQTATKRLLLPTSINPLNGVTSYEVTWWEGGLVNGDQYENRTLLVKKTGSDPTLLYAERGVDWGIGAPTTTTLLWICAEVIGITAGGVRCPFPIKTKFKIDNAA